MCLSRREKIKVTVIIKLNCLRFFMGCLKMQNQQKLHMQCLCLDLNKTFIHPPSMAIVASVSQHLSRECVSILASEGKNETLFYYSMSNNVLIMYRCLFSIVYF